MEQETKEKWLKWLLPFGLLLAISTLISLILAIVAFTNAWHITYEILNIHGFKLTYILGFLLLVCFGVSAFFLIKSIATTCNED